MIYCFINLYIDEYKLTKVQCFDHSHDHIEIIVNAAGELLFFRQREGPWMPTLRLLHKCKII